MEGDAMTLLKVASLVIASMSYARLASIWIDPGKIRFLFLLPVTILLPFLPWQFSSVFLRSSSAFLLVWLSTFKLLLLSFGVGPLSPSLPCPTFVAVSLLPVKLSSEKTRPTSFGQLFSSLLLFSLRIYSYRFKTLLHPYLLLAMYALHMYLLLRLLLASAAFLGSAFLGLELEPPFDAPFVSESLQDFWGRRWNLIVRAGPGHGRVGTGLLIVNGILRPSVYIPVRDRCGVAAGYLATFLVSGIMHEVVIYYLTLARPTGSVLGFFLLHGLCTVAEGKARRAGWWRPSRPVTLGFVAVTGFWMFLPGLLRGDTAEEAVGECLVFVDLIGDGLSSVASRFDFMMMHG